MVLSDAFRIDLFSGLPLPPDEKLNPFVTAAVVVTFRIQTALGGYQSIDDLVAPGAAGRPGPSCATPRPRYSRAPPTAAGTGR